MVVSTLNKPPPTIINHLHDHLPRVSNEKSLADENFEALDLKQEANTNKKKSYENPWDKARHIAEIVCSRESVFRSALDLTGWEIPMVLAGAMRNVYSFAEAAYQAVYALSALILTPNITKMVGEFVGRLIMKPDEHKDIQHYMLFQTNDLDDHHSLEKGKQRIIHEEPEDYHFLSNLYKNTAGKSQTYLDKADSVKKFFHNLQVDDNKLQRIRKLKNAVLHGQGIVEGIIWAGQLLTNRWFRKYILKQDGFTGTASYTDKTQSKKVGDVSKFAWWQKIGVAASFVASPVINSLVLNKVQDKEQVAKSPWLQTLKSQWDMTHGIYPKLGLMVSSCLVPTGLGMLFTAQGRNELIENLLMFLSVLPSWWFGHRVTNGVLAQNADIKLSEKFGTKRGLLVEEQYLEHPCPEPAKIQHVLKASRNNPELRKAARDEHAKVLYKGFALHSLLILGAKLIINQITKWRVERKLAKDKVAN